MKRFSVCFREWKSERETDRERRKFQRTASEETISSITTGLTDGSFSFPSPSGSEQACGANGKSVLRNERKRMPGQNSQYILSSVQEREKKKESC